MFPKGVEYLKAELPDFTFENHILTFDEKIEAYDEEFSFRFIEDTTDEGIVNVKDYKNKFLNICITPY